MSRFLIEVPHGEDRIACTRAIEIFLNSGSHFLSHADWGCKDGEHKAWLIVDVEDKESARQILPPSLRSDAKIVLLTKFMRDDKDGRIRSYHF
jgi:hypothetical protein